MGSASLTMFGVYHVYLVLCIQLSLQTDPPSPDVYQVQFDTDIEDTYIVIQVTRSLAPLGSDRFYALVSDGFFNESAFFRVVPNFVLQFGISGSPYQNDKWLHNPIKDDPVLGSNTRGTISFATAGPDTRSSQVFINYKDNAYLDELGFSPFGEVISGLETAEAVHNPTPGDDNGVEQDMYEHLGNEWIREEYPGINFVQGGSIYQGDLD